MRFGDGIILFIKTERLWEHDEINGKERKIQQVSEMLLQNRSTRLHQQKN